MKIPNIPSVKPRYPLLVGIPAVVFCLFLMLTFGMNAGAQSAANPDKQHPEMKQDVYKVDRLNESAIPAQKHREWNTLKQNLAVEYTDCAEDCGQGDDCEDRCWEVYNFRLDREYQRMIYEGAP